MNITNNTNVDYWFGPMRLPANGSLMLDDTSDTSIYLLDDAVADQVNTLYQSGMIGVTSAAAPFPRPTGVPSLLHGTGSPQGLVYAPQGSLYMRRDTSGGANAVYAKTTGVTTNTGWDSIASELIGAVTGTFDLVNSTAETSLISGVAASSTTGFKIPANTLGVVGAIRLTLVSDYLNNSGANQTCTIRVKFGGTVFYGDAVGSIAASANRYPTPVNVVVVNLNATNSNLMQGFAPAWAGGAPTTGSVAGLIGPMTDRRIVTSAVQAIDTTADQYLDVTAVHGAANANLSIRRHAAYAEAL
jgi:hypothetical protein